MSAFWVGLLIGIVLGTFLAFLILLFFMGVSERMTKEEWESHYRLDDDHAIRRCRHAMAATPGTGRQRRILCLRRRAPSLGSGLTAPPGGPPRAVPPQTLPN
jgi:hypothetical protein